MPVSACVELEDLLAAYQRAQAFMFLPAGWAALEVGAQTRNRGVGVLAGNLELDVAVEFLKAGIAADVWPHTSKEPAEHLLEIA